MRMLSRPCAALATALTMPAALPAAAQDAADQTPPQFTIDAGGWVGGAVGRPDDPSRVGYCGIRREFDDGLTVVFTMNLNRQAQLSLVNPTWTLSPGVRQDIRLRIDALLDGEGPAVASAENVLTIPLGEDPQLVEALRQGSTLTVNSTEGENRIPLTGTSAGLAALQDCVAVAEDFVGPATTQPPAPADAGEPAGGPRRSAVITEEALSEILRAAGIDGFRILPREEVPDTDLSFAWEAGPIIGGLLQSARGPEVAVVDFADAFVERMRALCPGQFEESLSEPQIYREIYAVMTASLQCESDQGTSFVAAVFTLDDYFYSAFYHEGAFADAELVLQQTGRIEELVRALADGGG